MPLEEALTWIEQGEKQRDAWAKRPGKAAGKLTESFEKHLRKLRKQVEKLQPLWAEQGTKRVERRKKK